MPKSRVEIARAGEYWGHWQGGYMLTPEDLQRMASNFTMEVVIDYEHATHDPMAGMAPAAGWVQSLAVDGESLWGEVEWTERAATMIDSGEYRYLSPVFDLYAVDPVSGNPIGAKLVSVGLTNVPFIEGMESVAVQNTGDLKGDLIRLRPISRECVMNQKFGLRQHGKKLGDLLKRLRDEKDLTNEDLAKGAGRAVGTIQEILSGEIERPPDDVLRGLAKTLGVSLDRLKEALPAEKQNAQQTDKAAMSDQNRFKALMNRLGTIFGTQVEDELDVLDEARQLKANSQKLAEAEARIQQLEQEKTALEAKVGELSTTVTKAAEQEDEVFINAAIADFKIPAKAKDDWMKRIRENRDGTKALINSIEKGFLNPSSTRVQNSNKSSSSNDQPTGRERVQKSIKVA